MKILSRALFLLFILICVLMAVSNPQAVQLAQLNERHADRACAERVLREVTALYTCGPAGGGGLPGRLAARPGCRLASGRRAGALRRGGLVHRPILAPQRGGVPGPVSRP